MNEIKYGKSTVLATAILLKKVQENIARLEEINWDNSKSKESNLVTSDEQFCKLGELADELLDSLGIDTTFAAECIDDINVSLFDHSGDDSDGVITGTLIESGIYNCSELTSDWLAWYRDTKESKEA